MTRARAAAVAAAVVALSACGAFAAKPNRRTFAVEQLPAWVREAASTPTPATDAAAVILHDETIVRPLAEGGVKVVRRFAARPLKRDAVGSLDTFLLGYRRDDRNPELRGWTVAPDGRSAAAPDPVLDRRDDAWTDGANVADDARLLSMSAANPAVGATFASESAVVTALDLGAVSHTFGRERIPVLRSRLTLEAPEGWAVAGSATGLRKVPCGVQGATLTCDAENVPPLPDRQSRPPAEEALSRVWARWWSPDGRRGFEDWNAVATWYDALTAPVFDDLGEVVAIADRLRPAAPEDLGTAIERLFDYVSRDVRYVSIQLGIGGYLPHAPALVASRKFGDCKDKTFLLRAVLERWGLRTHAVVVKVRDEGVVDPDAPTVAQFNHVIAGVVLPDGALEDRWPVLPVEGVGRLLLLDGTARGFSPWDLPQGDQGTRALLVRPDGGTLVTLPVQPPSAAVAERTLDAAVDENGTLLAGTLRESLHSVAAASLRAQWTRLGELQRRRSLESWLQQRFPGSRLGTYEVEGLEDAGRPVVERTTLEGGWFGKRVAGMLIVTPGRAGGGLFDEPLPASSSWGWRASPREERLEATIRVPSGFAPESIPAAVEVRAPGVDGRAAWSFEQDVLRYRRVSRLTASSIEAADYPAFRDAVRRLDAADATAVVFVKAAP